MPRQHDNPKCGVDLAPMVSLCDAGIIIVRINKDFVEMLQVNVWQTERDLNCRRSDEHCHFLWNAVHVPWYKPFGVDKMAHLLFESALIAIGKTLVIPEIF